MEKKLVRVGQGCSQPAPLVPGAAGSSEIVQQDKPPSKFDPPRDLATGLPVAEMAQPTPAPEFVTRAEFVELVARVEKVERQVGALYAFMDEHGRPVLVGGKNATPISTPPSVHISAPPSAPRKR